MFGQGSSFDVVALSRSLKGKDWRQALHRFDAFCEARGQPDLVAFNVLIRDAPWVMSVELMQDILPMRPDVVTISTVVKCCTENSVWLPSTRLLAFARQSSVEVDRVARNSLMFGFCQGCCSLQQMSSLIGEILWDILVLLDDKALLELGGCARYLLIQCERRRLQCFLLQVKSPDKQSKLRLSDGGHVNRKLCPPQKRSSRLQNVRPVQSALTKLSRMVKDDDQLVIASLLPWVECGDQSTRACALRALGRLVGPAHRKIVGPTLLRCIRVSSLNAAAMTELGNTLQRLVSPNDPDIANDIFLLVESADVPPSVPWEKWRHQTTTLL
eukprot:g26774.t1